MQLEVQVSKVGVQAHVAAERHILQGKTRLRCLLVAVQLEVQVSKVGVQAHVPAGNGVNNTGKMK